MCSGWSIRRTTTLYGRRLAGLGERAGLGPFIGVLGALRRALRRRKCSKKAPFRRSRRSSRQHAIAALMTSGRRLSPKAGWGAAERRHRRRRPKLLVAVPARASSQRPTLGSAKALLKPPAWQRSTRGRRVVAHPRGGAGPKGTARNRCLGRDLRRGPRRRAPQAGG